MKFWSTIMKASMKIVNAVRLQLLFVQMEASRIPAPIRSKAGLTPTRGHEEPCVTGSLVDFRCQHCVVVPQGRTFAFAALYDDLRRADWANRSYYGVVDIEREASTIDENIVSEAVIKYEARRANKSGKQGSWVKGDWSNNGHYNEKNWPNNRHYSEKKRGHWEKQPVPNKF